MIKILLIEDSYDVVDAVTTALRGVAEVLSASDSDEAEQLFRDNPDLALISFDGTLDVSMRQPLELLIEFKQTFSGIMVAASGDRKNQEQLMKNGCSVSMPKPTSLMDFVTMVTKLAEARPK